MARVQAPLKPKALFEGATIGIVTPASPPLRAEIIDDGVKFLRSLGFTVKLAPHARERHGYLAGSDAARAKDIMTMLTDPEVHAIMAVRGGYGCMRLMPLISFSEFRKYPKIFLGFSDVTALLVAIHQATNFITFHGPSLGTLSGADNEFGLSACLSVLMGESATFSLCEGYNERHQSVQIINRGMVSAPLVGGNLTILGAMQGTPYAPKFNGKIVFLEDVGEAPYRIDRLLTQLILSGAFAGVKGIAVGLFAHCKDPHMEITTEYRQSAREVIIERLAPLGVPLVLGLPFGHVDTNGTLPFGGKVLLDAEVGDLIIDRAVQ